MTADLLDRARRWRDEDPDPETRAEVDELLAAGDDAALADRFGSRLAFGTAGLRGPMGAGPSRMNRATVRFAAGGVARWVRRTSGPAALVAVGWDARHRSADFAGDSAAVFAAEDLRVAMLPGPVPTPVLAFAVRHLGAAGGVMVTASHNPPADNGYKVYASDGAQIAPPVDAEIAAAIDERASLADIPLAATSDPRIERLGDSIVAAYLDAASRAVPSPQATGIDAVYTPLHGVGAATFLALVARMGFTRPHVVAAQAEPDPDFPTVAFPNPEEPGALDLALAAAEARGADVVVANDPDADRVAVAARGRAGRFRLLTGDELGCLLADHLLAAGAPAGDRRRPLVATTVVSSRLLARIAAEHGAEYAETLTGFKWLVRPALAHPELRPVLAYEEALGYAIGDTVRDKDGMTAGVAALGLAAEAKAAGESLLDRLDGLARRHGVHATGQVNVRDDAPGGLDRLRRRVETLRRDPPRRLAGRDVDGIDDLLTAHNPPADALVWHLAGGTRVVVRPSGTEPKLKAYVEVVVPVPGGDVAAARARAAAELDELRTAIQSIVGGP